MADIIGGFTPGYPGKNNQITGTAGADNIFGDPYTTGNTLGVQEIGGPLSSGKGGNDRIDGLGGGDRIFGDAWAIASKGRGGNDRLSATGDGNSLFGDAQSILGTGHGGNDSLLVSGSYSSGDVVHWVRFESLLHEFYDVAVLRDCVRPMAIGFQTDEIRRAITIGGPEGRALQLLAPNDPAS